MESHLNIQKGGDKLPEMINRQFKRKKRKSLSVADYVQAILNGNIIVLSQAITLVESNNSEHQKVAQQIVNACLPHSGNSIRIGVTGTPGVGKSTFVEAMGEYVTNLGKRLAVLAIDPTSQISHGSILGDKTRMETLANNKNAFIRPSAAGDSLGGVARKTRETIILCEAAGYDVIFVETVGVGQSEVAVHSMVDFFLLLLLPGAGDELQGIKRGVVEMADIIAINKADGDNLEKAKYSRSAYRNGLHMFPAKDSGWIAKSMTCSAIENTGIIEIWQSILQYQQFTNKNEYFQNHRNNQAQYWLNETIQNQLKRRFENHPMIKAQLTTIKKEVQEGKITPFAGAALLMDLFLK
ncbi:MAG: LAO/AO transport system kinase [Cognaticolwellia sp.]|jgi:LAO/AO transport system kinase